MEVGRLETEVELTSDDPHDFEQVIFNLVINARDALPAGGTIGIDVDRERLDATHTALDPTVAPGEYVRLRVRDNGIGMAPDVQSHLFEPFFTTKEVGEGTGLGLAFVQGIARGLVLAGGQRFALGLVWPNCDAAALCRAARNLCGTSGLPSSEV